jgi:hypothetical protein
LQAGRGRQRKLSFVQFSSAPARIKTNAAKKKAPSEKVETFWSSEKGLSHFL